MGLNTCGDCHKIATAVVAIHVKGVHPSAMADEQREGIGARIAEIRKIRGATQQAVAMRANVSYSMYRKVERGERLASPSFIAAIARALAVSVTDVTKQPYGSPDAVPTSEHAGIPALRQALVEGSDPEIETETRSLDDLGAALTQIKEWDRRTRHAEAVRELPDILRHLHRACNEVAAGEQSTVRDMLAAAYSYAVVALYRLGHLDLAHLADERARTLANAGTDTLRAAVAEWNHALILLFDGTYPAGLRAIDRASEYVDLAPRNSKSDAVKGALHLRAAILAARVGSSDLADEYLNAAAPLVAPSHERANHYGTKFGAANVIIHRVAVPVELSDGTTAVTRASSIRLPAGTAPSRSGHYWIDLSRAWLMHGDRRRSFDALGKARRIAPQLTRNHPQVHAMVHALSVNDARTTDTLANFAAWCGVRN